jgi:hypothetical protein
VAIPATTTARILIDQALDDLGVKAVGEALSADDAQDALQRLNDLIDTWELQPGTILNETRETFPLIAGRGGPNSPYLIGPGAIFDTVRPTYVNGFKLLLVTGSAPQELWLDNLTDQAYRSIAMKTFSAIYPTAAYFNETYPWATLFLYPVPTTGANSLVMYSLKPTAGFLSLTTPVALAPGYREALHYNLARRLAAPFSQPWTSQLDELARSALSWVKTANTKSMDMALDPALTFGSRKPWNIFSDQ